MEFWIPFLSRCSLSGYKGFVLNILVISYIWIKSLIYWVFGWRQPVRQGILDTGNTYVKDAEDMIKEAGYDLQTHAVETSDGFILIMHRIVSRRSPATPVSTPGHSIPIFLMHGCMMSSDSWICLGANRSLPFMLVDAGYDVWMGNQRGNKYSHINVMNRASSEKYWDFSLDEVAMVDVPAMIDVYFHLFIIDIVVRSRTYKATSIGLCGLFAGIRGDVCRSKHELQIAE